MDSIQSAGARPSDAAAARDGSPIAIPARQPAVAGTELPKSGGSARKPKTNWQEQTARILAGLSIQAEYEAMGVRIGSRSANAKGWLEAYAIDRDERNPSACINLRTGYYKDSAACDGRGDSMSLFDFAVRAGRFTDWKEARKHFAEKAGVATNRGRPPKDPEELVEWVEWNDLVAQTWCSVHKPGVTLESLKLANCRMGRYPKKTGKYPVIAMPSYGDELVDAKPTSYVLWNLSGGDFEFRSKKTGETARRKMQTLEGTEAGLMNYFGLFRLTPGKSELIVWKVEGPTDAMALQALVPPDQRDRHLVVTNSGGSTQSISNKTAHKFLGVTVFVLHDADMPGELGAAKWLMALHGIAASVRQVKLPYTIEPKRGKDLRHWINEGHTFDDLLLLAKDARDYVPPPPGGAGATGTPGAGGAGGAGAPGSPGSGAPGAPGDDPGRQIPATTFEEMLCRLVQLDVLGEMEGGPIKVFAEWHRKSAVIPDISRLTYQKLLQIAGPPVKAHINAGLEPAQDLYQFSVLRDAIALLAGYRRIGSETEIGVGCWSGRAADGSDYPSVVLVGAGEGAEWNGDARLERVSHPRCRGHLLDLSASEGWCDFTALAGHLEAAGDPAWSMRVVNDAIALFSRWRWKEQQAAPMVVAGLVLATWVQTLWAWRPQVAIPGASQSGKTTLFDCLGGIFGTLAIKSSQSTAAGIRQAVRTTSRVVLCDEFEDSKDREEVLKMLRVAGKGDRILRGTPGQQRGVEFGLRHIAWVAAIEVGLHREPDRNRFIMLDLVKPAEKDHGKLTIPTAAELADLGQKLLAVAIRHVQRARELAVWLKNNVRFEGISGRVLECYSVPAAMLAAVCRHDTALAERILGRMLAVVEKPAVPHTDEDSLIEAILGAHITMVNRVQFTIGQLIERARDDSGLRIEEREESRAALEVNGLRFGTFTDHPDQKRFEGEECLILAQGLVSTHILRSTVWARCDIGSILRRIPDVIPSNKRIGGKKQRVLLLRWETFKELFHGTPDGEPNGGVARDASF